MAAAAEGSSPLAKPPLPSRRLGGAIALVASAFLLLLLLSPLPLPRSLATSARRESESGASGSAAGGGGEGDAGRRVVEPSPQLTPSQPPGQAAEPREVEHNLLDTHSYESSTSPARVEGGEAGVLPRLDRTPVSRPAELLQTGEDHREVEYTTAALVASDPPPPSPSPPPPNPPPPPSPNPPPPQSSPLPPPSPLPPTLNLADHQGVLLYVHSLSAAQNLYYCYRIEVGVSILQDFTGVGTPSQGWGNARCASEFTSDVSLGSLSSGSASQQLYSAGDSSSGCTTADKRREASLQIIEVPGAADVSADVAEPTACTYHVTVYGPSSAFIAPPHSPPTPPSPPPPLTGEGSLRLVGTSARLRTFFSTPSLASPPSTLLSTPSLLPRALLLALLLPPARSLSGIPCRPSLLSSGPLPLPFLSSAPKAFPRAETL